MTANAPRAAVEILVVEDSATQAEQLRYVLEREGYRLAAARNGEQALAMIERHPPTLVVSDVVMPGMDGYELCRHIKRAGKVPSIPVILLTSLSDPADVVRGLECGADSFIFKPYDEQYLLARIAYLLANRDLRENEGTRMGVEIFFAGRKFFITSDRLQILNLLLSTYEAAVHRNQELLEAQTELRRLNEDLDARIRERTAALQLEVSERKQAEIKLQAQLTRLDLLRQIARAIAERQDLNSLFQVVIRRLEDNLPIDFGCVCLYDAPGQTLTVANVGQQNSSLATGGRLHIEAGWNGLARCLQGQLLYEPDLNAVEVPIARHLAAGGLRALVMAPLLSEGQVFGVLIAGRRAAHAFSSTDCEFLRQLSEQVGLAAHQTELYSALQKAYDDLRETQRVVVQQERLRALGEMASGVAHDINNAITPAALYIEALLERESGLTDWARGCMETIQRAVGDVAQTVLRMREFYRPREPEFGLAEVDCNRMVLQTVELTRAKWCDVPQQRGRVIEMRTELAQSLPKAMAAETELRDALTNLIFNAVDAMPDGGTLTLRTHPESAGQPGEMVCLEVCDTGIGMDSETRRRCLEPFFTTKGDRGTGLGLAMVYGMARRHGAEMEIDSEAGQGTRVRLMLPSVAHAAESSARLPALKLPAHSLRVLIVDDDPLIIESLKNTLESDGHEVVAADGGQAGIDTFLAAHGQRETFEVVVTDLGMPYVDGHHVAAAVKRASPTTPVVLLTGWGQRLTAENETPAHVDRVLSKPPRLHDLRATLAEVTAHSE